MIAVHWPSEAAGSQADRAIRRFPYTPGNEHSCGVGRTLLYETVTEVQAGTYKRGAGGSHAALRDNGTSPGGSMRDR